MECENGATGVYITTTGDAPGTNRYEVSGDRGKIVVEDNAINRDIASELLRSVGVALTTAVHGQEAVDILLKGPQPPPFDLVLMDLQMPLLV
jgi:response regulator RpfG family c-di-GMP phosphodiesterase